MLKNCRKCSKNYFLAKFLIKTDDDVFVNVPNLIHILLGGTLPFYKSNYFSYDANYSKKEKNRFIAKNFTLLGYSYGLLKRITNVNNKWYAPDYMYSDKFYPRFLNGYFYVMTSDTANALYEESFQIPIFHLEDVFITGIVANKLGIERKSNSLFFWDYDQENMCSIHSNVLQHKTSSSQMLNIFKFAIKDNNCPLLKNEHKFSVIISYFFQKAKIEIKKYLAS